MTAGRPFSSHTIAQLEAMENQARIDPVLRAALADELSHRKTAKARGLAARLEQEASSPDAGPDTNAQIVVRNGESVTVQSMLDDLELLRSTFSEAGEILARWGMTESMPREIREVVLDLWHTRLANSDAPLGRTSARLAESVRRLALIEKQPATQPTPAPTAGQQGRKMPDGQ